MASLLKKARQHVRRHLPLRAADAVEIPMRAFMHEKTFRDFDFYDRLFVAQRIWNGKFAYQRCNRRLDRIVADVPQPSLHDVDLAFLDAFYLLRLVVHAEHEYCAVGVRRRCKFVRYVACVWINYPLAWNGNCLQLQQRIFAERDLADKGML